jgi:transcription elongation factor GreA
MVWLMQKTMNRIPLTVRGAERLKQELQHLKCKERPKIIQAIAEARSHGDLSENAEYHAAKDRQGFIESRIKKIEHTLSLADVIDCSAFVDNKKVVFGVCVHLKDLNTELQFQYQIVGEEEANIKEGLLSVTSPLARGLIGKELGDIVEVIAPNGERAYEIIAIICC